MGRGVGLISLLATLALVGLLWSQNMSSTGPTSGRVQQARHDASAAVNQLNFSSAGRDLEFFFQENATFVGATLPPAYGVTLVRTDPTSYCMEARAGGQVEHVVGPGGAVTAGPC